MNVQVLGISVDHVPVLKAWAEDIGGITYPLMSDFWPHGEVARKYGVFREDDGEFESLNGVKTQPVGLSEGNPNPSDAPPGFVVEALIARKIVDGVC